MGTPRYMPPEQARGDIDRVNEQSDVFGLGAILCEILTGQPPYLGEGREALAEAAMAKLDGAMGRLDVSGADPKLIEITKRCLAPAQAARPANAGELAQWINAYLSGFGGALGEGQARRREGEHAGEGGKGAGSAGTKSRRAGSQGALGDDRSVGGDPGLRRRRRTVADRPEGRGATQALCDGHAGRCGARPCEVPRRAGRSDAGARALG